MRTVEKRPEVTSRNAERFHGHRVHLNLTSYWLIFLVFLRIGYSSNGPDVEGEALIDFLRFLNDSNHLIDWNNQPMSTCFSWPHVNCRDGNVVSLVLDSKGFSGTLSPAITKLKYLVSLELQNNDLTGELPDFLGDMENLQILNLANNKFSGNLPATWGRLSNLRNLILRGNHLSGPVPDTIANISKLTELDLSSNDLTGKIPVRLFSLPNFNFTVTHLLCGSNSDQPCVSRSLVPAASPKRLNLGVVAAIIFGIFFLFSLGAIFSYQYLKFRKQKPDEFFDVAGEDDQKICLAQLRRFSWGEIQIATDNFSESTVIGKGGFGKVYRGVLSDGTKVAVKRLTDYYSPGGEAAFQREVQLISIAVHRNLLRLTGFCTTSSERILVYPYMKNLSVAYHLRDLKPGEKGLDWPTRNHIALGAARGLEYLHEHCNPKIIHRDMKAANILLDDDFEAVLGDFGLAKPVDPKLTHVTTQVRGTMGHIAPEYLSTGKSSEKTDVFGYGITLLELVTGRRATDSSQLEEVEVVLLLDHIKKLLKEDRLEDMVDRNLVAYNSKEVEMIVQVALLCTQDSPKDRPRMSEVVNMLRGVGLSEMWARWEQSEGEIDWRYYDMSHHFARVEETTELEAIQLSSPR